MASEEFLRFLEALLVDEDLRGRFSTLEARGLEESIAAIVQLGVGSGFRFDRRDVVRVIDQLDQTVGPDLLSTGELEIVAGGRSGEPGAPAVTIPAGARRTVLIDTRDFHSLLDELRATIEREGGSAAVLESFSGDQARG